LSNDDRPGWDEYFLGIAKAVSERADCTRRKVGAVLVDPKHRIISTGYNGAPSGAPGCLSGACPRGQLSLDDCPPFSDYGNCISTHAERNAILYSDPHERDGTTLYITCRPCTDCHQLILDVGVKRVVWWTEDGQIASELQFH
jgi:dCMP deaminase